MPYLEYMPEHGPLQRYALTRTLSTIGSAPDAHIRVEHASIHPAHATLIREKGGYRLQSTGRALPMRVGGKKCRNRVLAHGDIVYLGEVELVFSALAEQSSVPQKDPLSPRLTLSLDLQDRLQRLSQVLLEERDESTLLQAIMDEVIGLCSADKGFLVIDKGREDYQVCVSRSADGSTLANPDSLLSDGIVRSVLESQSAKVIADARKDRHFSKSQSVMDLKLSSVLCVPLTARADFLGLIYVGSDRVTHQFENVHLELLQIFAAQAALIVRTARTLIDLRQQRSSLSEQLDQIRFGALIGACPQMIENFRRIEKIAPSDVPLWLHGEPGTGKELLVRELHRRSARIESPLVVLNCAVIPPLQLERELFGSASAIEQGHSDSPGALAKAAGGTLFLAEIEQLPASLQLRLIAMMRDGTRLALPSGELRIVASSVAAPTVLLSEGKIREELYFRLSVVDICLPPLRDRGDDLELIARYLVSREKEAYGIQRELTLSRDALSAIRAFDWPGNIRQLENHIKKAIVLADQAEISARDLGLNAYADQSSESSQKIVPLSRAKEQWQCDYINQVLALNNGNRAQTARDLGVDPRTIFRHLERQEKQKRAQAS